MGKSKKRQRSRSRDSSDSNSRKELSKRLRRLENLFLQRKTGASEVSPSEPGERRSRSPGRGRGRGERSRRSHSRARATSRRPPSRSPSRLDASLSRPGTSLSPLRAIRASSSPEIADASSSPNRSQEDRHSPDIDIYENPSLVLHEEVPLLDDLSNILGEDVADNAPAAQMLHEAIARRWGHIVTQGLSRDVQKSLLDRFPVPANCTQLNAPVLNPEIGGILGNDRVARDRFNLEMQGNIGKALAAMGKSMSILLETENIPIKFRDEVLAPLGDAGRILSNLMHNISATRRNLIIPSLKKSMKDVMEKTVPSEYLFGSDVSEKIKTAKALESTVKELKVTPPVFSQTSRSQRKGGGGSLPRRPLAYQHQQTFKDHQPLNRQGPARRRGETRPRGQPLKDHRGGTYRGKR